MSDLALEALVGPGKADRPEPAWRAQARTLGASWLAEHRMPTRRDESWRYTPVDQVISAIASVARPTSTVDVTSDAIDALVGVHDGPRLVFVNGGFHPGSSKLTPIDGVDLAPLSSLPDPSDADAAGLAPEPDRLNGFTALNGLAGDDGASVRVRAGAAPTVSIHLVHVSVPEADQPIITHPASTIVIEAGAHASIIESYAAIGGAPLTNASTVIDVADHGQLTYHRVQTEPAEAVHIGYARIRLAAHARAHARSLSIGARISRVELDVSADGDHASIDIDGLYVPNDRQHHDHVITIDHIGSHTRSNQRFKGVVDGHARGAFTGKIVVRPGTTDTEAHQANDSLVLTPNAQSDTRPWLEILADDVRCTHGATIGRLDDQSLFYLRSRGIPLAEARRILIEAFSSSITEAIEPESLRRHLSEQIARASAKAPA